MKIYKVENYIQGEDISYLARRGDMFFINRGSTHSFSPVNSFTYYNICFSRETVVKRVIDGENALDLLSLSALEEIQSEATPIGKFSFDGDERLWLEHLLCYFRILTCQKVSLWTKILIFQGFFAFFCFWGLTNAYTCDIIKTLKDFHF